MATTFRQVRLSDGVQGRLYLHSMPGRYEDLIEAWKQVKALGVGTIVCLAPLDEVREKSPHYAAALEEGAVPCPIRRFPVCDYQGPDDDQAFQHIVLEVADLLRNGERILVHCGAGIGRTGMFVIGVLMALGLSGEEARRLARAAGSHPERQAQEQALHRLAQDLADQGSQGGAV